MQNILLNFNLIDYSTVFKIFLINFLNDLKKYELIKNKEINLYNKDIKKLFLNNYIKTFLDVLKTPKTIILINNEKIEQYIKKETIIINIKQFENFLNKMLKIIVKSFPDKVFLNKNNLSEQDFKYYVFNMLLKYKQISFNKIRKFGIKNDLIKTNVFLNNIKNSF